MPRFNASSVATATIKSYYETSGNLQRPLVMGHNTKDPIQLFWHLPLYQAKTVLQGKSAYFTGILVPRYGHCTFTEVEIIAGFASLLQKVQGQATQAKQLLAKSSDSVGKMVQSVRLVQ